MNDRINQLWEEQNNPKPIANKSNIDWKNAAIAGGALAVAGAGAAIGYGVHRYKKGYNIGRQVAMNGQRISSMKDVWKLSDQNKVSYNSILNGYAKTLAFKRNPNADKKTIKYKVEQIKREIKSK